MKNSWKTTLCGILGALCAGLATIAEMPVLWAKIFTLLSPTFANVGLLFARDNKRSDEQVGAGVNPTKNSTMKPSTLLKLFVFIVMAFVAFAFAHSISRGAEPKLSAELLGALKYPDLKGPAVYGAGADVGYKFNRYVSGHVRLLAYETDDWGGGAIDEGSLLVEAKLLRSANGKLSLSAIGGGHRDFQNDDWGFGVGLRGTAVIYKQLSAFAQGEIIAYFSQPKAGLISAGLQLPF